MQVENSGNENENDLKSLENDIHSITFNNKTKFPEPDTLVMFAIDSLSLSSNNGIYNVIVSRKEMMEKGVFLTIMINEETFEKLRGSIPFELKLLRVMDIWNLMKK